MNTLATITEHLIQHPAIEVVWLYGSRATGQQHDDSDYDLAIAFKENTNSPRQQIDDLQYQLNQHSKTPVSIIDINRIPVPLALNVITEGKVLLCRSDFRLRLEQQRIWSLWEEYKYQHERNRKKL